jgi:hypothetical protein
MDRNQVVTIAVTAAISIIFKEVLTWGVALAKNKAAQETTRAKARNILNPINLGLLWSVAWLSTSFFFLISNLKKTAPIERTDILIIALWTGNILVQVNFAFYYVSQAILHYRKDR